MLHFFAKRMTDARKEEQGFTLVELLVVMIIVGILAAIAVPAFLNQREQANQAACRSDVRNGVAAANSYAADQPTGDYTGLSEAAIQADPYNWNLSAPSSNPQAAPTADNSGFTLSVDCAGAPAATYSFDSAAGVVTP